ncbi:uncharacterized protein LOC132729314 [Ruditapes philippinarum]|uniref:uncharacterized protein LOC132729314 n=1 Tax=Ruditapes philippinarum TaxID=129788 RepID=UPI00295C10C3|nr:uncharacterized protein LOC132729314 [Ruditapes philippinarum]XP_060571033.1 uncharacterized protein LOC132729314 [Ruditapes philippinarum]
MSVPYIPGVEEGTSLEGNIEISASDLQYINFPEDKSYNTINITQSDIADFGDEGFLLHNILSDDECRYFIDEGERLGFETIRGVRDDYRSCKRITIDSKELSAVLWSRIKSYVHDITVSDNPHSLHIHGSPSLMKGTWKPIGLNNIFRLCRYFPGGHFAPHFDGHYDASPSERSLKTFMLYLNGDFSGGATNFVDESQTLYKDEVTGKYCAEEKNILCSVQPEAGLGILFNHHRLHEGAQLKDGVKYILRTDIMFKNVDQKLSEEYIKAVKLLQQAETLENGGECMKAVEFYRQAFKLAPELENSH